MMKKETINIFTTLAMILAMTCSSWALDLGGWDGPIKFNTTNWDSGTVYVQAAPDGAGGYLNEPLIENGQYVPLPDGVYDLTVANPIIYRIPGKGSMANEDSWGITVAHGIYKGIVSMEHSLIEDYLGPNATLWHADSSEDQGVEIVAMFWGVQDKTLTVTGNVTEIGGEGLQFEVWVQPKATFWNETGMLGQGLGSAGRLAANKYVGIGYTAAGNPVNGAYLLASGTGAEGFVGPDGSDVTQLDFYSTYNAWGQAGEAKAFLQLGDPAAALWNGPGAGNDTGYNSDWYWSEAYVGFVAMGYRADLSYEFTTTSINAFNDPAFNGPSGDWTVKSFDDIMGIMPQPVEICECRVTGGGNDTWDEEALVALNDELAEAKSADGWRYTFGGQAGSPTGCQPQPWGEWTHTHHTGANASFTFHAGTASAPEGTEIDWIQCSDPGWCIQARPAPAKQIDFKGVGTFKNTKIKNGSQFSWMEKDTLYEFEVHIEDLGEPGNTNTKKNPLLGTEACPDEGRDGLGGELANCGCPDFYRIRIINPDGDDYEVYGYINGGNLQIHPAHPCK